MDKITVALDMGGCPNRCKHCWLSHTPNVHLDENALYYVANEFKKIKNNIEIASWYREPDFLDNYMKLYEIECELSNTRTVPHYELLSFWRAVRDTQYVPWLKQLGVKKCQLTLFGGKEKTDYYTGRVGAFDEIMKTIDILFENQIVPRIQIFINKDNINELKIIEELITKLKLQERCEEIEGEFSLFVHQGSCDGENMKNYDIWITPEDIDKIPKMMLEYTLKHFNKNNIIDVFGYTEQKLLEKLSTDENTINYVSENPVFYIDSSYNVYPNITNPSLHWSLGNFRKDGIENIIDNYVNNKSMAQSISISKPICELAKEFGNNKSQRLFGEDDYKIYLLNKYCENMLKNNVKL